MAGVSAWPGREHLQAQQKSFPVRTISLQRLWSLANLLVRFVVLREGVPVLDWGQNTEHSQRIHAAFLIWKKRPKRKTCCTLICVNTVCEGVFFTLCVCVCVVSCLLLLPPVLHLLWCWCSESGRLLSPEGQRPCPGGSVRLLTAACSHSGLPGSRVQPVHLAGRPVGRSEWGPVLFSPFFFLFFHPPALLPSVFFCLSPEWDRWADLKASYLRLFIGSDLFSSPHH